MNFNEHMRSRAAIINCLSNTLWLYAYLNSREEDWYTVRMELLWCSEGIPFCQFPSLLSLPLLSQLLCYNILEPKSYTNLTAECSVFGANAIGQSFEWKTYIYTSVIKQPSAIQLNKFFITL